MSRKKSAQRTKIFGIIPLTVDFWKTEGRIPLLLVTIPLLLAAVSLPFVKDVALILSIAKLPISTIAYGAVGSFFLFISILPAWVGFLVWRDMKNGIRGFGEAHPTLFLRILKDTNLTIDIILILALEILIANQFPVFKMEFTILPSTPAQIVVTTLSIYSWTLVFEVLTIIMANSWNQDYFGLMTLSILSTLEDKRFPFANDLIRYFNRYLRGLGFEARIRRDIKLSPYFFTEPAIRRTAGRRLLMAVDQGTPLDFVNVIADIAQMTPLEAIGRTRRIQFSIQALQTLILVITLVAIVLSSPVIEAHL